MKLSQASLDYFTGIITGDAEKTEYRSGPKLVQFFNGFGETDEYGQGFPARASFVQEKLQKFNGTETIGNILEQSIHPGNILSSKITKKELISEVNDFLAYDGYKFVDTDRGIRIKSVSEKEKSVDSADDPFEKDMFRLFISHKDDNKRYANELKTSLEVYGISAFVAHEDIDAGAEWQKEIENALFSMDALLALCSSGFSASVWTNQEIGVALGRGCFILSVRDGEDPRGFISKLQALRPKEDDTHSLAMRIAQQLLSNQRTSQQMKDAYIEALSRTSTFSETEKWTSLINSIHSLTQDQIDKLILNFNANYQAHESFALNGDHYVGHYEPKKSISDYLNSWTGNTNYSLRKHKIQDGRVNDADELSS